MKIELTCKCGAAAVFTDERGCYLMPGGVTDERGRKYLIERRADEWQERHQQCLTTGVKPCPHCDAPPGTPHSSSCPAGVLAPAPDPNLRWNDRFMEVLTAIHGPVDPGVNDSARLAFAQTLSEIVAAYGVAPTDGGQAK
jgi:hypothetical protein